MTPDSTNNNEATVSNPNAIDTDTNLAGDPSVNEANTTAGTDQAGGPDKAESQEIDSAASEEIQAAKAAFDADTSEPTGDPVSESAELNPEQSQSDVSPDDNNDDDAVVELAVPFVGQWNQLISTTNWEKGRIIGEWRQTLIDSGVDAGQYSDEAWTRRVGGVTAPHVGRLRRVYDRFASTYQTYEGLYWSHFLAALDWDDAPLWLEGASKEKWSVAGMRGQRWQAHGAVESNRPTSSQIVDVDLDEDVDPTLPQSGGDRTKQYGDEPGTASGPVYEAPDFGDEEELMSMGGTTDGTSGNTAVADPDSTPSPTVQPFAGLPELPDDLTDAVESFKLALLRHKSSKWENVSAETIEKYLQAFAVLLNS
jgi:hypothetical protein